MGGERKPHTSKSMHLSKNTDRHQRAARPRPSRPSHAKVHGYSLRVVATPFRAVRAGATVFSGGCRRRLLSAISIADSLPHRFSRDQ